ncbi:MAG: hypothetical protein DHS20C01_14470 [marine bacterium B5-7]|nr:MAG: hypothetical protein DHS20C01_14470 [marine bacterium B5-7]
MTRVAAGLVSAATPMERLFAMAQSPVIQGIHQADGVVRVNGQPVTAGDSVSLGDTIETGPDARAIYVVGRSAFLQRSESRVELDAPEDKSTVDSPNPVIHILRILTGKLLSVHARGKLTVETANGSIGIRGTGLYVDVQDTRTYACICYGTADLFTVNGEKLETVKTRHHESPRYLYPDSATKHMEQAPVINHTDDELILLESLTGRKPPFVSDGLGNSY